jgi:predicted kinase
MSRVVFMCGPSGAGKSTYARRLEEGGMVRLSFDAVAWHRGIRTVPFPPGVHEEIAEQLEEQLLALVAQGRDVVLDFSFWSRSMRARWRALLVEVGVVPETVYLATDRTTVLARVRARQLSDSDDFGLDEALAADHFDHFEPPTADEGPLTVVGP